LQAIGGFAAIAEYLADDFMLGNLVWKAGYKVVLSDYVVEHALTTQSFIELIRREIRWNRGMRVSRHWGYAGLIFTQGIPFSLLFFFLKIRSLLGLMVLAATWGARLVMGYVVGFKFLKDRAARKHLWLAPLADLLAFVTWCYSFFGNVVEWRGQRFRLTKLGELVPIPVERPYAYPAPSRVQRERWILRAGRHLAAVSPALPFFVFAVILTVNPLPVSPPTPPVIKITVDVNNIEIPPPPVLSRRAEPPRQTAPPAWRVPALREIWSHADIFAGFFSFGTLSLTNGAFDRDDGRLNRNREFISAGQAALWVAWGVGLFKQENASPAALEVLPKENAWRFQMQPIREEDQQISIRAVFRRRF